MSDEMNDLKLALDAETEPVEVRNFSVSPGLLKWEGEGTVIATRIVIPKDATNAGLNAANVLAAAIRNYGGLLSVDAVVPVNVTTTEMEEGTPGIDTPNLKLADKGDE